MTPYAIILQHAAFEGPGRLASMLSDAGYLLDIRRLDCAATVPTRLYAGELLIVMGGPMGIAQLDDPAYPYLRAEIDLLTRCIAEDAPVLGVCLGAQLLAAAAGATVAPMRTADSERVYEVGWGSVRFHKREGDRVLAGLPDEAQVLHWHGDMFELPRGARLLASSERCVNQAFQLGSRQFGLQFHCEARPIDIECFLLADLAFVEHAHGPTGAERIRRDSARNQAASAVVGERLLSNLLSAMGHKIVG